MATARRNCRSPRSSPNTTASSAASGFLPPAAKHSRPIHPATEEVIAQVAEGDAADVDLAVDAAREPLITARGPEWTPAIAGPLMFRLADLMESTKRTSWPPSKRSTTASRSATPWRPIFHW